MFTGTVTGTELARIFNWVDLVQDIIYRAVVSKLSSVYFLLEAPFSFWTSCEEDLSSKVLVTPKKTTSSASSAERLNETMIKILRELN